MITISVGVTSSLVVGEDNVEVLTKVAMVVLEMVVVDLVVVEGGGIYVYISFLKQHVFEQYFKTRSCSSKSEFMQSLVSQL